MKVQVDLFPVYLQMLRHSGDMESMDEEQDTQKDSTGAPFLIFCWSQFCFCLFLNMGLDFVRKIMTGKRQ